MHIRHIRPRWRWWQANRRYHRYGHEYVSVCARVCVGTHHGTGGLACADPAAAPVVSTDDVVTMQTQRPLLVPHSRAVLLGGGLISPLGRQRRLCALRVGQHDGSCMIPPSCPIDLDMERDGWVHKRGHEVSPMVYMPESLTGPSQLKPATTRYFKASSPLVNHHPPRKTQPLSHSSHAP